MRKLVYWFGALSCLLIGLPGQALAAKATFKISYDSRSLATTLYYPDKASVIRGVLVFTGGASGSGSGDTRGFTEQKFWQRFGDAFGFGVIGTQFSGQYATASGGTGQALLDTLAAYAKATQHPELEHVPLLLEGFSNGGYFSFTFAQFAPERVIAFCLNKSGFAKAPLDEAFLAVPGLLLWGSEEPAKNVPTVVHSLVQQGRAKHALWAELKEWGAAHEEGEAERAFAPFFAEMIAARYPIDSSPLDGPVPLIALREQAGWLADNDAASIEANVPRSAAFADYDGDRATASWLPSESMANVWRGFATEHPISLTSPAAGAQLDANQSLQLTATGIPSADSASFWAGATTIADHVTASGGQAKAYWTAAQGGVQGLLVVATNSNAEVTRVSRPVQVVLFGKPAPQGAPAPVDTAAANGGAGGSSSTPGASATAGAGGERAPAAQPTLGNAGALAADGGAPSPGSFADRDSSRVEGGCSVCGRAGARSSAGLGVGWVGLWLWFSGRRRAHVRSVPAEVHCESR